MLVGQFNPITVTVTNGQKPIGHARIEIITEAGEQIDIGVTNAHGQFRTRKVDPGLGKMRVLVDSGDNAVGRIFSWTELPPANVDIEIEPKPKRTLPPTQFP